MIIAFIITLAVVLIDQLSKGIVMACLSEFEEVNVIDNFFYFTKTYNTGAAWSSFSNATEVLACISFVASLGIGYLIYRTCDFKTKKLYSISLGLILGGTLGNFIDRFLTSINQRDGVVDFIGVYLGSYDYPAFNIADSCLVVGVILLAVYMIFFEEKNRKKNLKTSEEESNIESDGDNHEQD